MAPGALLSKLARDDPVSILLLVLVHIVQLSRSACTLHSAHFGEKLSFIITVIRDYTDWVERNVITKNGIDYAVMTCSLIVL